MVVVEVLLSASILSGLLWAPAPAPTPAPAPAEPSPELRLTWDAPPSCPGQDVILERVAGSLGRPLGEAEGEPVQIEAKVRGEPGRLTLSLRTQTAEGVSDRELTGTTCDVLVDAAALVIAVALDPSLAFGPEPEPEPEPKPEPEPPSEPKCIEPDSTPPATPTSPAPTTPSSLLAGTVRAAGTGSLGPLPSVAPGFEVAVGVVRKRARVELGFDYFFARRVASAMSDTQGGEIQLWTLSPRGCFAPTVSILQLPLCAGLQTGPMRGEGYGVSAPTSTRLPWLAVEAGGAIIIRGLPIADIWVGADLVVPVTRPGFFLDDLGLIHRAGIVGGEAAAGLEVRFGPGRRWPRE